MSEELFESIRVENGQVMNLDYHQKRLMQNSQIDLYNLASNLQIKSKSTVYKWRLSYLNNDVISSSITEYKPKDISTLKLIECNNIEYGKKYNDRSIINSLLEKRGQCDDILIVKNNYISDTSFSNILFKKEDKWFTPLNPLLKGTCRARLLDEKIIIEDNISVSDLPNFNSFMLINAMLNFSLDRAKDLCTIYGNSILK